MQAQAITVDTSGNIYIAGSYQGVANADATNGNFGFSGPGDAGIFVSKLDSSGNLDWIQVAGNSPADQAQAIVVDAASNVYLTGTFSGSLNFNSSSGRHAHGPGFAGRFRRQARLQRQLCLGRRSGRKHGQATAGGLAINGSGDLYLTGSFSGTVGFNTAYSKNSLTSAGASDVYVAEIVGAGVPVWSTSLGGSAADMGLGIAVDARGNVYTTGSFSSQQANFAPAPQVFDLSATGTSDMFLSRIAPQPVQVWTGLGSNSDWSNAANWANDQAPAAGANLEFDFGAAQLTTTNDLAPGTLINSVTIVGSGYTINGNSLTLGPAGIQANAAGGSDSFQPAITLPNEYNTHISVTGGTLLLNGSISGPGGLTKNGSGTLVLSNSDISSGGTTVTGGMLVVDGSLAGDASVLSGATLAGDGSIAGSVIVAAGGTLAPGEPTTGTNQGSLSVGSVSLSQGATLAATLAASSNQNAAPLLSAGLVNLGGDNAQRVDSERPRGRHRAECGGQQRARARHVRRTERRFKAEPGECGVPRDVCRRPQRRRRATCPARSSRAADGERAVGSVHSAQCQPRLFEQSRQSDFNQRFGRRQ